MSLRVGEKFAPHPNLKKVYIYLLGVPNFVEIRDRIIEFVRTRPLFGAPDVGSEMLEELRRIREAVEK